jgi:hypothetical protein
MSDLPKLNPVTITKFTGDRKSAVTSTGKTVYRQDKLWMGKQFGFVHCAEYSSNFLYHDPDFDQQKGEWPKGKKFVGRFTPLCSCGAFGVVVGATPYSKDRSATDKEESTHPGQMVVCHMHVTTGVHKDGSHD